MTVTTFLVEWTVTVILAIDANRNGRIDNGSELFGNATLDGFEVLARYDDNGDGQITSADAVNDNAIGERIAA